MRLFTALNYNGLGYGGRYDQPVSRDTHANGTHSPVEKPTASLFQKHFRAFPDMHHEIQGITVESERTLAFEWRATGTFTAPLATPGGEVPPNGKTIDLSGADFWQVEGGLIVIYHVYFDRLEFLRQLGLTSPS